MVRLIAQRDARAVVRNLENDVLAVEFSCQAEAEPGFGAVFERVINQVPGSSGQKKIRAAHAKE
jgi:hypothetical protein